MQLPGLCALVLDHVSRDLTRHTHHALGKAAGGHGLVSLRGLSPHIGHQHGLHTYEIITTRVIMWDKTTRVRTKRTTKG